jgi:hypothetical protein
MIAAAVRPTPFNRDQILRFFDNADDPIITPRVVAGVTGVGLGNVVADRTKPYFSFQVTDRIGQCIRFFIRGAQEEKSESCRSLFADSRELGQLSDQSSERRDRLKHSILSFHRK